MTRAGPSRRIGALAAACALLLAIPSQADSGDAARAREAVRTGRFVPVAPLLDRLEREYFGRVIEVEVDDDDEPPTYEVEWLTPRNQVIEFEFDARTGALLEIEGRGADEARRP